MADADPDIPDAGADADEATLIAQKVDQAADALARLDIDCWLTYCRETAATPDPSLPLLLDFDVVWPTAVLVTREGRSAVVLGRHDAPNARELGVHEVVPYDESIRPPLLELLEETDPDRIALNYDEDDPMADGLSHGLYLRLRETLADTPYADALVGGGDLVAEVRGRKSEAELARIAAAVETTEEYLRGVREAYRPDWTERDVSSHLHARMDDAGFDPSWSRAYCPAVHAGGDAEVGHTKPGDRTVRPGELLHVDFGVTVRGYAADIQRVYYRPRDGEAPPKDLRAAFEDVRAAIRAGFEVLEPGAVGHEVDDAARTAITDRGREEYPHALGHQVGREAHDGATLLGPEWDRYGDAPRREVRAGEVYTLELGVETDYGYVGGEEMVLVGDEGARYLSDPQEEIWTLSA
ncbi:aminopeptidase P family protein [Halobacteriales archaeon QS_8_69_26]|nr:MAG: aminopeptidase P family protein [Halobacteriales archaeon QS_8_69_26]